MGEFAKLAKAVLKDIKEAGLDNELLPTEAQLESGIGRLISDQFLTLGEDSDDRPIATLVDLVKKAVGKAQKESGVLSLDNLFGVRTLNWLQFANRCFNKLRKDWKTNEQYKKEQGIAPDVKFHPLEVRYFIKGIPTVEDGDALLLLRTAWESWTKVCGMVATQCPTERDANVIITLENLDGPSNVLGDAHIGPPERTRLTLRFDAADHFTAFKFEATACHEIGHLLGLEHTGTKDQLMASTLGTLKSPQLEDAKRAQMFWGPPHPITVVDDDQPVPGPPSTR